MKTNELVKTIEEAGLDVEFYDDQIKRRKHKILSAFFEGHEVLKVSLNHCGEWFVRECVFDMLEPDIRHKLMDAFIELAYTPVCYRTEND